MNRIACMAVLGLMAWLLSPSTASAQTRAKENFEQGHLKPGKAGKDKKGWLGNLLGQKQPKYHADAVGNRMLASKKDAKKSRHLHNPTTWNSGQQQKADAIWLEQRALREELRKRPKHEPTAWEKLYAKQEKQHTKERRQLMNYKDKLVAQRHRKQQRAFASSQRYQRSKAGTGSSGVMASAGR